MRYLNLLLAGAALAAAPAAFAQVPTDYAAAVSSTARPAADTTRDAARKPAEMLAFAHVRAGAKVVDFLPGHGYFTRLFAVAVKPGGSVVAVVPAEAAKLDAEGAAMVAAIGADKSYGNVSVASALSDPAVTGLDLFWTAQNYHDLHNALPPEGVTGFNRAVFAALKPGGYYVVVDHAAPATGLTATKTLHRIDPAIVKAEVTAAGFVFDGESTALANPADPHTAMVFDPAIRGKTDQFAYRFRKPS